LKEEATKGEREIERRICGEVFGLHVDKRPLKSRKKEEIGGHGRDGGEVGWGTKSFLLGRKFYRQRSQKNKKVRTKNCLHEKLIKNKEGTSG